jgi:hypothetical protein
MLESFKTAFFVNGRKHKDSAQQIGVCPHTLYRWSVGMTRCPHPKRQSVDRAFGTKVDWALYDDEVDAAKASKRRPKAPLGASPSHTPPKAPETANIAPPQQENSFGGLMGWGV